MEHYKDETGRTFPGKVLPSRAEMGQPQVPEIQTFEQTPSDSAAGTGPDVAPHELFQYFTAGIILQNKVFIR